MKPPMVGYGDLLRMLHADPTGEVLRRGAKFAGFEPKADPKVEKADDADAGQQDHGKDLNG